MTDPVRKEMIRGARNIAILVMSVIALNVFVDNDKGDYKPTNLAASIEGSQDYGPAISGKCRVPVDISDYLGSFHTQNPSRFYKSSFLDGMKKDLGFDQRRQMCVKKPYLR